MPRTSVVIYRELDGSVPLLDWLDGVSDSVQNRYTVLIGLLAERGYDLRRQAVLHLEKYNQDPEGHTHKE
jgi:hypothetical protein